MQLRGNALIVLSLARLLHLSAAGWQRVARLAWELDRRGEVLPLTDLIIGVTALEHQAAVLTFDRHFQKIPGLVALSELE
jgi:predicted nucleic acid-binding protein